MKKICLNMVIKENPEHLKRCLASVKPWIDTYEIVDCTSGYENESAIKETLGDITGGYHQCSWVSDLYAKNIALQFAKEKSDYLLFLEPDDELITAPGFDLNQVQNMSSFIVGKTFTDCYETIYVQKLFYHNFLKSKWIKENGSVSLTYFHYPYTNKSFELNHITTRFMQNKVRNHEL